MILWQNSISNEQIEKKNIDTGINFYIRNQSIKTPTPTMYILDENMNAIFKGYTTEDLLQKISLLEGISKEELIANINENYFNRNIIQRFNNGKPTMIYFTMEGCPDCKISDEILDGFKDEFNMVKFYRDNDNVPIDLRDKVDKDDILAEIYGIKWYPSFIIFGIDGNVEVIGQKSEEDLIKIFNRYIH